MLSRILYGTRYTVGLALAAAVLASLIGTFFGLLAAVSGRWVDEILSRLFDALISIPSKVLALVVIAAFGSSIPMLMARRRARLYSRRVPHFALACGQPDDARIRAGRESARRRASSTSRASKCCRT